MQFVSIDHFGICGLVALHAQIGRRSLQARVISLVFDKRRHLEKEYLVILLIERLHPELRVGVILRLVFRACRYAAVGFDDAQAAGRDGDVTRRANKAEAAKNLAELENRLAEACVALKVAPDALLCETPSRLDLIREKAAVELGKELKKNEALLHADYDLTLREIRRRLKAEVSSNK